MNINQIKRCSFKTINFEQGLMNNETGSVFTDPSGFTWVSTQSGMQRFNGYRMENINPVVNGDTIIIDHPVIFFPLNNGRVWISYKEGILEYDFSRHLFRKVITLAGYPRSYLPVIPFYKRKEKYGACMQKKGSLFIMTMENSVSRLVMQHPLL